MSLLTRTPNIMLYGNHLIQILMIEELGTTMEMNVCLQFKKSKLSVLTFIGKTRGCVSKLLYNIYPHYTSYLWVYQKAWWVKFWPRPPCLSKWLLTYENFTIFFFVYWMMFPHRKNVQIKINCPVNRPELKTLEWWISRLMLDPLF